MPDADASQPPRPRTAPASHQDQSPASHVTPTHAQKADGPSDTTALDGTKRRATTRLSLPQTAPPLSPPSKHHKAAHDISQRTTKSALDHTEPNAQTARTPRARRQHEPHEDRRHPLTPQGR